MKRLDGAGELWIAGAGKEGGRVGRVLLALGRAPDLYFDVDPKRIGRVRHGARVIAAAGLGAHRAREPRGVVIAAVGTSGTRTIVRSQLAQAGFVEGETAFVVA